MKTLTLLILVVALVGCSGPPSTQRFLNKVLPPDFQGPVSIEHNNPYFSFELRAGNVRRVDRLWQFDWLWLKRKGYSNGTTIIGTPPPRFWEPTHL